MHRSDSATSPVAGRVRPTFILAAAALALLIAASPAGGSLELEPLRVGDTGLIVDRPTEWWIGGTVGYGVLVSLIGRGEGFPNFSVMTDPEWERGQEATEAQLDRYLEDLFGALVAGQHDATVHAAGWEKINGLRVHSSLTSWESVAGRLRARRLLLMHADRPLILTWIEKEARYGEIEAMVERCVESLRTASTGGVVG